MSTIHGVALVRIWNAGVNCAARGSLEIHDAKKSPFWHHRTTLSGYIFGTKACIHNRKKILLNSNTSSTCPDNVVNFGLLTAEICWRVWGTPANFNGFRVLAALLHGTIVVGVSQTLRRWTEGATLLVRIKFRQLSVMIVSCKNSWLRCPFGCGPEWAEPCIRWMSRSPMRIGSLTGDVICTVNGWLKEQDQQ